MLRGVATVSFWADDLEAAREWYTELLGTEAYFNTPGPDGRLAYTEFRIGDYQQELGLIADRFRPAGAGPGPAGAVLYWQVDDVQTALERLLGMGATEHEAPADRGEGFVTATVIDPFGNILGIMHNPHYLEILRSLGNP